jgi:hypothetical protein
MNAFSPYSPLKGGRAQRHAAAVALGAGALALIAGCAAAGSSAGRSAGSGGAAAKPLSPHAALTLAADQSERVNSMATTFSSQLGGSTSETTTGAMQLQLKPSLVAEENLKVTTGGKTTPMDEIITAKALYLKSGLPSLGTSAAKPWLEIDYTSLKGSLGSALSSLLQNVQNGNPAAQTQMLAASKNVHEVGTQVVDGVQTTHYAGSFTPSAALAALSPSLRKTLGSVMKSVNGDISFNVWIDGQHVSRKVVVVESVQGETVTTTMNVTSVNQPVDVTPPPASQVTKLPASSLGSV